MDTGAINWTIIDIIAVVLLGAVLLWAVLRTRSKGRETSDPRTEEATRELYKEEDRAHRDGMDGRI